MVGVGVELTDSLVAVIVAEPNATAVTVTEAPFAPTVNTALLLDLQVMMRPLSTLLLASFVTPANCWVLPITIGVVGADIVTEATGASDTAMDDVPV
jgi:hypothetical protein